MALAVVYFLFATYTLQWNGKNESLIHLIQDTILPALFFASLTQGVPAMREPIATSDTEYVSPTLNELRK
ncbi:MAG: hypothetical protein R2932_35240 [Caldilineaceae bacterium]